MWGQRRRALETVTGLERGCVDVVSLATERMLGHAVLHSVYVGALCGRRCAK